MGPMLRWRALLLATPVLLALGIAAGAALPDTVTPDTVTPDTVTIDNFAFDPTPLTVAAGTKVTWDNKDEEPHTVVSADGGKTFKSEALDTDDNYSFTFATPGTYKYFCSIHPHMVGSIVVK